MGSGLHLHDDVEHVLFSREEIARRVGSMARWERAR